MLGGPSMMDTHGGGLPPSQPGRPSAGAGPSTEMAAAGQPGSSTYPLGCLPSTLEQALQPSSESRIITEPAEPFRIVHVNEVWCRVCGYDAEEAIGQTCRILQGLGTCHATLAMLKQALVLKRSFAVQLLNYTKQGRPFMNTLQVAPLTNAEGQVTHYLGVVCARFLDGGGAVPAGVQHTSHAAPVPEPNRRSLDVSMPDELSLVDPAGGSPLADGGGRVPPFLMKLSEILMTEPPDVICSNPQNASFTIRDVAKFSKEVLPRYFKHNKLGSFSQQLHTYGFRRKANSSSMDAAIEFYHDQFSGDGGTFLAWIRSGGALSKRTTNGPREVGAPAPPNGLVQDMLAVQEGTRQLGIMFAQAKATHGMQLRTILMKLMLRGMLAPESANYISNLPPATPMLPGVPPQPPRPHVNAAAGSPPGGEPGTSSQPRLNSTEGLQAQLDALEAGLTPLSSQPFNDFAGYSGSGMGSGGMGSGDLQGEDALSLFMYASGGGGLPGGRHAAQPYPIDAAHSLSGRSGSGESG